MAKTYIVGARVIDGRGNPPTDDMTVVVAGDRIEAVQSHKPTAEELTVQDRVIDARGKTVLPGLIDAHCHMTYGESMLQSEQDIYSSVEARTLRSAWNVRRVLAAGVTGISQPGGSYFIGVAVRDGIAEGRLLGPRMASAGRYISTSNGLSDFYPDEVGVVSGGIGIRCNTLDEMITEVRRQAKNGVDFIKLADSSFGQFQSFRDKELFEIADLAHQLGLKITIHARGNAEVNAAIRAGFDWIMHGNMMTQETVDMLAESRIPLVPTLVLLDNWKTYGQAIKSDSVLVQGSALMLERTKETLHQAHEAGVVFGMGTDSGFAVTPYGEWHAKEIELLMEYAGLSALEAIQAATFNNGRSIHLEGQIGAIEAGMLADLLIVDGDPSSDITVLQDKERIEHIMLAGEFVTVDAEESAWPYQRAERFGVLTLTRDAARELLQEGRP